MDTGSGSRIPDEGRGHGWPESVNNALRPDSPRDFGAIQIIYLLTYVSRTVMVAVNVGDRSFYVAGPRVWNRLPGCLRS